MNDFNILRAILVFLSMIVDDIFWTLYIRRTSQGMAVNAALFSSAITICSAFVIISYVENWIYTLAAALGAFVGTWLTVRHETRSKKQAP